CPAWLELIEGKYRIKEDAARAIRKIHEWCAAGLGTYRILDRLNEEGIPAFGSRSGHWERSYVQKLLSDPAVVGIYQPCKAHWHKRYPDGDPIADYYPRVLKDSLRFAAQEAIRSRKGKSGRPTEHKPNLFSGLLWSALDSAKLHVHSGGYRYL